MPYELDQQLLTTAATSALSPIEPDAKGLQTIQKPVAYGLNLGALLATEVLRRSS